jgi:hypothetical protein
MDYNGLQSELLALSQYAATDPNWITEFPAAIDYAEGRIYPALNLLAAVVVDTSTSLTAGTPTFTLPTTLASAPGATYKGIETINAFTVPGAVPPTVVRAPLSEASKEFIYAAFPSSAGSGIPQFYAPINQTNYIVGPWPDKNYTLELTGNVLLAPLSATNTTTFISLNMAPLLVAACMIHITGFKMNFGAQASSPQQGMSWEQLYQSLLDGYSKEELRKRFQGVSWSYQPPSPIAVAPRAA